MLIKVDQGLADGTVVEELVSELIGYLLGFLQKGLAMDPLIDYFKKLSAVGLIVRIIDFDESQFLLKMHSLIPLHSTKILL